MVFGHTHLLVSEPLGTGGLYLKIQARGFGCETSPTPMRPPGGSSSSIQRDSPRIAA